MCLDLKDFSLVDPQSIVLSFVTDSIISSKNEISAKNREISKKESGNHDSANIDWIIYSPVVITILQNSANHHHHQCLMIN